MLNETPPLKAAVCAVNSQYIHSSLAPWYLVAGVQQYGRHPVSVDVLEHTINQSDETIGDAIAACPAAVIGFSCYIWNIATIRRLLPKLAARRPDVQWLLGGPEASFHAAELLQDLPMVSYILAGEGERSFACLLDGIWEGKTGEQLEDIPGLCYRKSTGEIVEKPPYYTDEEPPSPYTDAYFAALKGRIAYLETSRGCPFSCAFCLSGREDQVRFFSLDRAKEDILRLANAGCQTIKLVDRTFNCHKQRCYELLSFMIEQAGKGIPDGVCFHVEVAADLFDERTLQLLATAPAGLIQMEAGLQSFHQETLQAVTRRTSLNRLCEVIRRLLVPGNIHLHIDLIAGLPYEGWSDFADSFDKAFALHPHMLQLGFLKLLYGSRLRQDAEEYGYVYRNDPPYELISSRWLTKEEMARLHNTEDALERLYNSGRFCGTIEYLLPTTGWRPFDLFTRFGEYADQNGGTQGLPLDQYTQRVWDYFSSQPGVEAARLRDIMACDCLCSQRGGLLPPCLRRTDSRISRIKRILAGRNGSDGIKRSVAVLYSENERVAVAEYRESGCHPVTGHYPLRFYDIKDLLQ